MPLKIWSLAKHLVWMDLVQNIISMLMIEYVYYLLYCLVKKNNILFTIYQITCTILRHFAFEGMRAWPPAMSRVGEDQWGVYSKCLDLSMNKWTVSNIFLFWISLRLVLPWRIICRFTLEYYEIAINKSIWMSV